MFAMTLPPHETDSRPRTEPETRVVRVATPEVCCNDAWEQAYARFESPEQEIAKFVRRLKRLGQRHWPRDAAIVELFCGRGNGIVALERLGFRNIEGVDLSESLLCHYQGKARCYVADCRALPFDDASKDVLIVQGGLHHLPDLEADLPDVLGEAHRVLREAGRLVVVEPWTTPFLVVVERLCGMPLIRRLSKRADALATMIELEQPIYQRWLEQPEAILDLFDRHFQREFFRIAWGKLFYVGRKPSARHA